MQDTYDSVPYSSFSYAYTHPDLLCVLGRLFGLSPAPPTRCRVLELGCASGGNLIPMAELLPDSTFIGIDRSRVQIDRGRALVGELGLRNIELQQGDIMRLDTQTLGTFDYVICHGVFAWVPRPVQDRILALTASLLRPRGLAFISYNVYPGWHMREMVRRMMLFHVRRFETPQQQIEQARAFVDFVASSVNNNTNPDVPVDPYALQLERELAAVKDMSDTYLFHEHLESNNSPLYFHEFIERLNGLPLRYMCDSHVHLMVDRDMPEHVHETLGRIAADQISMEQYLDFVRNRQFRTSVLCRQECEPQRRLQPARAQALRFAMRGGPNDPEPSLAPDVEVGFTSSTHTRISSPDPLTKAALIELGERWPASLDFDELITAAEARVRAAGVQIDPAPDRDRLAADLIECLLRSAVTARASEPPHATQIPDKPRVSGFNLLMAEREGWLANNHHARVPLAPAVAMLVPLLDGTRDRDQLLAAVMTLVRDKQLNIATEDGTPVEAGPQLEFACASFLDTQLTTLLLLPALLES